MSFSSRVKEEICGAASHRECCVKAELAAFVRLAGTIEIAAGMKMALRLDTESEAVAGHLLGLVRRRCGAQGELEVRKGRKLRKKDLFSVRVEDEAARLLLTEAEILSDGDTSEEVLPLRMTQKECCRKSFLQGAFLAAGSVTDPEKEYHADITVRDEALGEALERYVTDFGLPARLSRRGDEWALYLKDADSIADLLRIVGAHGALLELENVRVYKSVRNQVNRSVNCETANLKKTTDASRQQAEWIQKLEQAGGFPLLSAPLRQAAELRLEYMDASLQELADMAPGVSRSAMNKRLRRIVEMAKEVLEEHP